MASSTQWTRDWAYSMRWWRTGKTGVLQSMGLQRVGHDLATEQQQKSHPEWGCFILRSFNYEWSIFKIKTKTNGLCMLKHLQVIYEQSKWSITWVLCMLRLKKPGPHWQWLRWARAEIYRMGRDCFGNENFQAKGLAWAKPFPNKSEAMPYSIVPSDAYVGHSASPGVGQGTQPSVLLSLGA